MLDFFRFPITLLPYFVEDRLGPYPAGVFVLGYAVFFCWVLPLLLPFAAIGWLSEFAQKHRSPAPPDAEPPGTSAPPAP